MVVLVAKVNGRALGVGLRTWRSKLLTFRLIGFPNWLGNQSRQGPENPKLVTKTETSKTEADTS